MTVYKGLYYYNDIAQISWGGAGSWGGEWGNPRGSRILASNNEMDKFLKMKSLGGKSHLGQWKDSKECFLMQMAGSITQAFKHSPTFVTCKTFHQVL